MKFSVSTIVTFIFSTQLFGQTPVDIFESTLKVGSFGEEVFYYGFAEGDQLIFNFKEVNGKELKELEIIELPSSSKFMDYKTKSIENKTLNITKTGIYKFRFSNSAISGRICKFKIQRIPSSEATKNFNTSVYWKTIYDTTYTTENEKYLIKSDTSFENVYSANPQVSSQNAINGNSNSQVVDFVLPTNTVSWSFYIGTGQEAKLAYAKAEAEFTKTAAAALVKVPGYGPMAALALTGISYISKVQGKDNVKYWFLTDANSSLLFQNNQPFNQYKKGDVVNEATQMKSPLKGKIYLGILNDNTFEPIDVTIKVTAIIVTEQWGTRPVQKMHVASHQEAYLKN